MRVFQYLQDKNKFRLVCPRCNATYDVTEEEIIAEEEEENMASEDQSEA